ncbi:MAG: PAS domain S-box protein [Kastovskya adunca ATA6-11-RM4]|nr:PAS domain S-box protein [Kastovskya adunca ATA6-11-RM4]
MSRMMTEANSSPSRINVHPMRSSTQIQAEIVAEIGYFLPFFAPALDIPQLLESLWQQTRSAYFFNPLPTLLKEKIFAYLSRYCSVSYCLLCHCCSLRSLEVSAQEILELITQPAAMLLEDITADLQFIGERSPLPDEPNYPDITSGIEPDSAVEDALVRLGVFMFIQPTKAEACRAQVRSFLGPVLYGHWVAFLGYIKFCHQWAESYPDLCVAEDQRAQLHLAPLLQAEPQLDAFFQTYNALVQRERQQREAELAAQVSQLQRLEQELRQSEERFRQAFVNAPFPMLIHAEDGEVVQLNSTWTKLTGYTHAEIPTIADWTQRAYGESYQLAHDKIERLYKLESRVDEGEFTLTTKAGISRVWEFSSAPLGQLVDGKRLVISMAVDITERKCAEAALLTSESRLNLALNATNTGIWDWDLITNKVVCSENTKVLLGLEKGQFINTYEDFCHFVHKSDRAVVMQAVADAVENREELQIEFRVIWSDQSVHWLEVKGHVVCDQVGHVIRQTGIVVDVTKRKQTEAALRESEQRFRVLFDQAAVGIAQVAMDGRLLLVNQRLCDIVGYTVAELSELTYSKITHPDDLAVNVGYYRQILTGEIQTYSLEKRYIRKDGAHVWVNLTVSLVRDAAGTPKYFIQIAEDISDRLSAQEALQNLVAGTAAVTGSEFFRMLVRHLAAALGVRYALVSECVDQQVDCAKAIAFWSGEQLVENFEYDLASSPCKLVTQHQEIHYYPDNLQTLFPKDPTVIGMEAVSYLGVPMFDTSGMLIGHLCVLDDKPFTEEQRTKSIVSIFAARAGAELERQRVEEALQEEKLRYQLVARATNDAIWDWNIVTNHLEWNDGIETLSGYSRADIPPDANWWDEMIHPDDYERYTASIHAVVHNGGNIWSEEYRYRRADGSYGLVIDRGYIVHDDECNPIRMIGSVMDITERVRAEEERDLTLKQLEQERSQLEAILQQMPAGVFIGEAPSGRLTMGNQQVEQIWRHPFLPSASIEEYREWKGFHPDGRAYQPHEWPLARSLTMGEVIAKEEIVVLRGDGTYGVMLTSSTPIRDVSGEITAAVVILYDITERKQAEQEIQELNEQLENRVLERTAQLTAANLELEAFAYSVSHDLRAPLRSINGFSQVLLTRYSDRFDEKGQHYLQRICANSHRMGELIDDLLLLSCITRSEMCHAPVNLSAIALMVVANLCQVQPQREVEIAIAPDLIANGDAKLLQIVLENLLNNAWKYTSHHDTARIEFGITDQFDDQLAYFVRDDGAGFDMAYADKLFQAFQRLHTEREFPGTGIGLATVQRIIHRHGGKVWSQAAIEQGATFYFTLPS